MLSWHTWLVGFGLTLLFEVPIVAWLLGDVILPLRRRLPIAVFANLLTHPLVWFFFPQLPLGLAPRLAVSELWAFGAEAAFYWVVATPITLRRASLVSLAANLTSFGFGWVVVTWFGRFLF
jgi:hypothetical protein